MKSGDLIGNCIAIKIHTIVNGRKHWLFECKCGKRFIREHSKLKYNNDKLGIVASCGCKRKKLKPRKPVEDCSFNRIFNYYKSNARKKRLEFRLSIDDFKILLKNKCFYCGCDPSNILEHEKIRGEFKYNGIDRIDNNEGYTPNNVVTCCKECNYKKKDQSYNDFIEWIKRVFNNMKLY